MVEEVRHFHLFILFLLRISRSKVEHITTCIVHVRYYANMRRLISDQYCIS